MSCFFWTLILPNVYYSCSCKLEAHKYCIYHLQAQYVIEKKDGPSEDLRRTSVGSRYRLGVRRLLLVFIPDNNLDRNS